MLVPDFCLPAAGNLGDLKQKLIKGDAAKAGTLKAVDGTEKLGKGAPPRHVCTEAASTQPALKMDQRCGARLLVRQHHNPLLLEPLQPAWFQP